MWSKIQRQIHQNEIFGEDFAILFSVTRRYLLVQKNDAHLELRPEINSHNPEIFSDNAELSIKTSVHKNENEFIYYTDKIIESQRFCIPLNMVPKILKNAHGHGHLGLARTYQINSK